MLRCEITYCIILSVNEKRNIVLTLTMDSLVWAMSEMTPSVMMRSTKYWEPSFTEAAYLHTNRHTTYGCFCVSFRPTLGLCVSQVMCFFWLEQGIGIEILPQMEAWKYLSLVPEWQARPTGGSRVDPLFYPHRWCILCLALPKRGWKACWSGRGSE